MGRNMSRKMQIEVMEWRRTKHQGNMVRLPGFDRERLDKQECMRGYSDAKQYKELDPFASVSYQHGWYLYWESGKTPKRNRKTGNRIQIPLTSLREKRIVNDD